MEGLVGIFDGRSDAHVLRRDVDRMRLKIAIPGAAVTLSSVASRGIACQALARGSAAARDEDSATWVVFDGELYNQAELSDTLSDVAMRTEPFGDAGLCLRLFLAHGDSFVERLNGQFNLVLYRAAEERLSIATDRFGYRPLYVATRGPRLVFGTAVKAILAVLDAAPAVDGIGLLQSLNVGWPLGDRTWLEGIEVAQPGSWLHATPARAWRSRYFRLGFDSGGRSGSEREYVKGLASVLQNAVRRRMRPGERVAIPLSGGLDSRALLAATSQERPPALTYTFGRDDSYDVVFAARLAGLRGVSHRHFRYDPGYLGKILPRVSWLTEGLIGFAQVAMSAIYFHDRIAAEADVILYGHCGDCLTGAHLPPSIGVRRSRDRLIELVFRQYNRAPEAALRRVLNETFYRRYSGDLFGAARDTFAGIEGETLADVLDVWDIENRQRRGTFASTPADRYRFTVRAPFLDHDVIEHVRQARLSWRLLQRAYKQMHLSVYADAADVPWAYTGRRLSRTLPGDFLQHGINYIARRLPRRGPDPRDMRDLAADTRGDADLARAITDFVAHDGFPGEIFDRRGIEATLREHLAGRGDFTHLVVMLATFAAAWRFLLFQPPAMIPTGLGQIA